MLLNFQILKDNGNGTIDVEVPVFTRVTIPHPKSKDGTPLTRSSLRLVLRKWVEETYPNTSGDIDTSALRFMQQYGLNEPYDVTEVLPELLKPADNFPMGYANVS